VSTREGDSRSLPQASEHVAKDSVLANRVIHRTSVEWAIQILPENKRGDKIRNRDATQEKWLGEVPDLCNEVGHEYEPRR
jgi:hypothetical protein